MALTNAEKQAAWRARRREELKTLRHYGSADPCGGLAAGELREGGVQSALAAPLSQKPLVSAQLTSRFEVPDQKVANAALCARVRSLRIAAGLSQQDVAKALGIDKYGRYVHWEKHSPMPWHFMPAFAHLVGTDLDFLLTGVTTKRIGALS